MTLRTPQTVRETITGSTDSIKRLHELERGQSGPIVWIKMKTPQRSRDLAAMGIFPLATVTMIANYAHHVIFKVDEREFAADREIASGIGVGPPEVAS
jgi:Fe2+ transport system protein FeoA